MVGATTWLAGIAIGAYGFILVVAGNYEASLLAFGGVALIGAGAFNESWPGRNNA